VLPNPGDIHRATLFREPAAGSGPSSVEDALGGTRDAGWASVVAEQHLIGADVAPIFEEMGGDGVAHAVRGWSAWRGAPRRTASIMARQARRPPEIPPRRWVASVRTASELSTEPSQDSKKRVHAW